MLKAALFIDGANLWSTTKALGWDVDYMRLRKYFNTKFNVVRSLYYTAMLDQEHRTIQPLVDWLSYNGFVVVTKFAKEFHDPSTGQRKIKGNMDVEMAMDMLIIGQKVDNIVLFTGDGDFRRVVEEVQRHGTHVTAISSTNPFMIAEELRRQVDEFIELDYLRQHIGKLTGPPNAFRSTQELVSKS